MSLKRLHWVDKFITTLGQVGNVSLACHAVGISRTTAYKARNRYSSFADQWNEAIAEAADILEGEARRRAVDGVEKPIYYKGVLVDTVREYSDGLLTLLLKAHKPERFRERRQIEHTGADGGPIRTAREMTDAELEEIAASG